MRVCMSVDLCVCLSACLPASQFVQCTDNYCDTLDQSISFSKDISLSSHVCSSYLQTTYKKYPKRCKHKTILAVHTRTQEVHPTVFIL